MHRLLGTREPPYINVLHDDTFDRVSPGTADAREWLEANVPDDDVMEEDLELDGIVVFDFEPLIEKAEAAGITVYRWNKRGLPLESDDKEAEEEEAEEEEREEEEIASEESRSEKPVARKPWPPGRTVISPKDVLGDEYEG